MLRKADAHTIHRIALCLTRRCARSASAVRLADAMGLAEFLTRGAQDEEISRAMSQQDRSRLDLRTKAPVYLTYFTAFPDGSGLTIHGGVYGWDAALHRPSILAEQHE